MSYPESAFKKAKTKASKIGVTIVRSTNKKKKLDVYKDDKKVASIGAIDYEDFNQHGDEDRRKRYHQRFSYCKDKIGTPCYYASKILW